MSSLVKPGLWNGVVAALTVPTAIWYGLALGGLAAICADPAGAPSSFPTSTLEMPQDVATLSPMSASPDAYTDLAAPLSSPSQWTKLQAGYAHHSRGEWGPAEQAYRAVLRDTRDPEEIAIVHELMAVLSASPHPVATPPTAPTPATTPPVEPGPEIFGQLSAPPPGVTGIAWFQTALPQCIRLVTDQIAQYLQTEGAAQLTRKYSEEEFQMIVVRGIQQRFPEQLTDVDAHIRANGFVGSGVVHLGLLPIPLAVRVGVTLVHDRPHAVLHEVRIGVLEIPALFRQFMETKVNQAIDQQPLPLKITQCDLADGSVIITAALAS